MRLVLDWDGTVTVRDSLWMVLDHFGDREIFQRVEGELGKTMSYRDVMDAEMATVTAPLEAVQAWLVEAVEVRPGFRELIDHHRPLILSGGFVETIEPVLAREGVSAEIVANRVDARPDGWRVIWNDDAPCSECGDLCKRRSLPRERPLVYCGDGFSDRCAALVADRVFARDGLAEYLSERDIGYEPFTNLHEVAAALG